MINGAWLHRTPAPLADEEELVHHLGPSELLAAG